MGLCRFILNKYKSYVALTFDAKVDFVVVLNPILVLRANWKYKSTHKLAELALLIFPEQCRKIAKVYEKKNAYL